jgi:DNA-binding GntR family transcriptional regulator
VSDVTMLDSTVQQHYQPIAKYNSYFLTLILKRSDIGYSFCMTFLSQTKADTSSGSGENAKLRVIPRVSLKDTAVQRICEAIEAGELEAGETLTELGLARKLGVAQPTIREAILELEFIGYLERTATRKIRVALLTKRSIDNIYMVRMKLELLAVELIAAQKAPQIQSCWQALQKMESSARSGALRGFFHADLEFHRALWQSSQNECVESALERIVPKLFAFAIIRHSRPSSKELIEICKLHRRILNAVMKSDKETACRLMEDSMEKAWLDDAQLPGSSGPEK